MRLSADEVSAAKHVPIARVVARDIKLERVGRLLRGLCPFHKERTPSFYLHDGDHYHCHGCGAHGDVIDYIRHTRSRSFPEAVSELIHTVFKGNVSNHAFKKDHRENVGLRDCARKLWESADAPEFAEFYLDSRGIRVRPRPLPLAVRGTRRAWCPETQQHHPALLAGVSVDGSSILAVQAIWAETSYCAYERKGAKAKIALPKQTFGRMENGAVQLSSPQKVLGIAEGIESAMSAAMLYRMPVWAALGAQRMGSIQLPEIVRSVAVFGDNGEVGENAAHAAVSEYRGRGYVADAVFPEPQFGDFNDQLNRP